MSNGKFEKYSFKYSNLLQDYHSPYIFNTLKISQGFFFRFYFLVLICLVDKKQGL